jgi:2-polyprenyl-3-methyl-5-hydroxy-6-metoxy-1,4-benzoquinol methylase
MTAPVASTLGTAEASAAGCTVCGGPTHLQRRLYDDRYGYRGIFRLYRCNRCGHRHLDATLSDAQLGELYSRFYPRSTFDIEAWSPPVPSDGCAAWWRGDRASAFRWVPRGVRVLDIGCGFGESLGYHRARGCDAHGVEADSNILRVAARHDLQVRNGLFDPGHYPAASFDVVTLDQVIEHVADPVAVLRGVRQVLKPGGTVVLSTPNADGWGARVFRGRWIHWHAPYHLHFFSRRSLASAAADAGLAIECRATVTNSRWLDFQWCHLAAPGSHAQPSVFWKHGSRRSLRQRIALRIARLPHQLGLNTLATRLMDTLGWGDNVVYVLRRVAA